MASKTFRCSISSALTLASAEAGAGCSGPGFVAAPAFVSAVPAAFGSDLRSDLPSGLPSALPAWRLPLRLACRQPFCQSGRARDASAAAESWARASARSRREPAPVGAFRPACFPWAPILSAARRPPRGVERADRSSLRDRAAAGRSARATALARDPKDPALLRSCVPHRAWPARDRAVH